MLTLLFSFASCNVVQMLKQTETMVPDAFFGKHHERPEDQLIFFEAGTTTAYYFDTQSETFVNMGETLTTTNFSFYPYNGDIYFSSTTQGFRYDLSPGVETPLEYLDTYQHKNFQEYQGHLLFHSSSNLHVIPYNPNGTISSTNLSGPLTNISWIHVDRRHENNENNGEKLFACGLADTYDYGLYELQLTYTEGQLDGYTPTPLNVDGQSVPCDQSTAAYGEDGYIIYEDYNNIYRYDIDNNAVTNFVSDANILSYENGEVILFAPSQSGESTGSMSPEPTTNPEKIESFHISDENFGSTNWAPNIIYQDAGIMSQVNVLSAPDGRYFFNKTGDNNNYQLYEVFPGEIPTQLTQFNEPADPVSIYYFQFGSRGIYIFTNNGIHLLEFSHSNGGFKAQTIPISTNLSYPTDPSSPVTGFKAISRGKIFHHN